MDGVNSFDYKVCPQCSEPVRITATKCPHCLSWQGRRFSVNNPMVAAFLPMLALPFLFFFIFRNINKPALPFRDYSAQVQVGSTELNYSEGENGNFISTIGRIQNNSPVIWERIAIEVQYFNASGELIDTNSENTYDLTLLPHTEHAFRVRTEADKPRAAYVSQKVFVRDATQVHRWE
jgi:hypothetical protein